MTAMTHVSMMLASLVSTQPAKPHVAPSPNFWMPNEASTLSGEVDNMYMFLVWLSAICALGILGAMVWFCIKYRAPAREKNHKALSQVDHSNTLEITWSIIPLILVIGLFVVGFKDYVNARTAPLDSYEIQVKGQKWKWTFTYPNGWVDDSLHVPKGKNVRLVITSADVIHSVYIPEFRVKMDAVPGRYTELWFNATMTGTFPLDCTEYCGTSHSDMLSRVIVQEPADFKKWLDDIELTELTKPPVELGQITYTKFGCSTCHSTDGTRKTGPSFKGIWGTQVPLADGSTVTVDENYIRESVMDPHAKVVQGFAPVMPTFKGQLQDERITGIIAFIKSLK